MKILKLDKLTYAYKDGNKKRIILDKLSYDFEEGKLYAILGPSGSGKTTLLSLMAGLDKTQEGTIYYKDKSIKDIGYNEYRRNQISIVFQQFNLINYLTAKENVLLALTETDNEVPKDKNKVALSLLNRVGIVESKANRSISKLSGGEQQRVAIARALASNVDLIFADEPTGNLDTDTEKEIIKLFKTLTEEYKKTIIVVTHSLEVSKMCDIRLKLEDGKLNEIKK